jgi:hypothetical protein
MCPHHESGFFDRNCKRKVLGNQDPKYELLPVVCKKTHMSFDAIDTTVFPAMSSDGSTSIKPFYPEQHEADQK